MLHQGLEPTSVLCLAFQSDTLPTEPSPPLTSHEEEQKNKKKKEQKPDEQEQEKEEAEKQQQQSKAWKNKRLGDQDQPPDAMLTVSVMCEKTQHAELVGGVVVQHLAHRHCVLQ